MRRAEAIAEAILRERGQTTVPVRSNSLSNLDAATLRGQAAHLRRLAVELSDVSIARTVSELAAAYEDQAARLEAAAPP